MDPWDGVYATGWLQNASGRGDGVIDLDQSAYQRKGPV